MSRLPFHRPQLPPAASCYRAIACCKFWPSARQWAADRWRIRLRSVNITRNTLLLSQYLFLTFKTRPSKTIFQYSPNIIKKDPFCIVAPNIVVKLPACHPFGVHKLQVVSSFFFLGGKICVSLVTTLYQHVIFVIIKFS